ncbi:response regulator [Oceanidesulfovibrio marinus]|uniref:Response regulator n=1 Tax=Oceanidesulfovibrio marinus TaxID=370038 RepID=A0A6P1ZL44_9BACT|nr:response regulator [Oceanidesulfovibrio marinus]QJT10071.1 response regulator [Oceanidesulfovibrio marinus]TVM35814.1 hypothetical protein DQK91_03900 [Oceanidesulfovibrio marinus]
MPFRNDTAAKKNILVVDPEKVTRLTFESILTRAGYNVTSVGGVGRAMDAMDQNHFHLVLADLAHGKGPALDLLAVKRSMESDVPIVVVDRDENSKSADTCFALGACSYLGKPVQAQELLRVVRQVLKAYEN